MVLTAATFDDFANLARRQTGINLDQKKRAMLSSRLTRRLRALNLDCFEAYLALLQTGDQGELEEFANVVSTNLTYFFREPHHFEQLRHLANKRSESRLIQSRTLRVWCSACSSGEEAYSIAMVFGEAGLVGGRDYKLLCTDINTEMVQQTEAGLFQKRSLRGLGPERQQRWFRSIDSQTLEVHPELRQGMICRKLNLFDQWPIRHGVDIIFCRNALIYFKPEQQQTLVERFAAMQNPGGKLFLGHSEAVENLSKWYVRSGNTVYARSGGTAQ